MLALLAVHAIRAAASPLFVCLSAMRDGAALPREPRAASYMIDASRCLMLTFIDITPRHAAKRRYAMRRAWSLPTLTAPCRDLPFAATRHARAPLMSAR